MKTRLIKETEHYLESILTDRSNEIYTYLDQQEKLIQKFAQNQKFIDIFTGIDKTKIEAATKLYAELPTIKNILFIKNDGEILLAIEQQENFKQKNILHAPWNNSELAESFIRSSMTLTIDISGFEFNPLIKRPALFISAPIINNNTLYGCIIFELDIEPIYLILRKYIGLKTTGEITLGRIKDDKVMYIAPTRHAPNMLFKSLENNHNEDIVTEHTMERAIFNQKGAGSAIDYRGQNVIAAWSYLTRLDWGIVAKIDTDEILAPMYTWYMYLLIFFILGMLLFIIVYIAKKNNIAGRMSMPRLSLPKTRSDFLWIGFAISVLAMNAGIYNLLRSKSENIKNALLNAQQQAYRSTQRINESIEHAESVVQAFADDLSSGKLSDDFVEKRIMTDLKENPSLIEITIAYEPYAYDKNIHLHAFSINNTQGTFKKSYFGDVYDYTKPSSPGEPETDWYVRAIKQGSLWSNPLLEPYTDLPSIDYSIPFFDPATKKPRGVVAISYNLQAIQTIIDEIKIGDTGYGFALSNNGTFISFPVKSYVLKQQSFMELAQERANEELMVVSERALRAKEPLNAQFFDVKTNQQYSLYITPIDKAGCSIGVIFAEDEVTISPLHVRHSYFFIIIALLLAFLCLAAIACNTENNVLFIKKFSIPATGFLFVALLACWKTILNTNATYHTSEKNGTIIVDQSRLDKFLNNVKNNVERSQSNEPQPLFMPTGIHVYSFSFPKLQHVSISGNIWQKIDVSIFKDTPKEIQLPQDISLSFKDLTKTIENNTEVRVSTFDATIFNEQNFSNFPFDTINIRLNLSSQDLARNIILIPDLLAYTSINPTDKPGIDKSFILPGFDIQKSFFSLKKLMPDNDFGLNAFRAITEHYELIYNIVIARKLLNSFILYILPLIVILIALFATLFGMREVEKYDPLKSIGAYASLFFGLLILHRTIREQYGVVSTLYIEYAFFYTYITMLLLVIHAIIVYGPNSNTFFDDIITPLLLYLFWPIQLVLWLTTTLYVFY
jgi:hypothetical protein